MAPPPARTFQPDNAEADITIWKEALFAADLLLLHASPVYYGLGIPRGDGSAIVLVPGFLGTDAYLTQLHSWLGRIGYRPYFSGIGLNAECPNLLIQQRLNDNIERALVRHREEDPSDRAQPGRHHRALGGRASVPMTSPRSLLWRHPFVARSFIAPSCMPPNPSASTFLQEHGAGVLPTCYTGRCTCDFLSSLRRKMPGIRGGNRHLHP